MYYRALMDTFRDKKALLVHCSRPGKVKLEPHDNIFPEDLNVAIHEVAHGCKGLACSVVWPGHMKTFGDVGIILKPRTTKSIMEICTTDGGTWRDKMTGNRTGGGDPYSTETVMGTFANPSEHNEWVVDLADTIGIFVQPKPRLIVSKQMTEAEIAVEVHGWKPCMGIEGHDIGLESLSVADIHRTFPQYPVYTFWGTDIVEIAKPGKAVLN